MWKFPSLLIIKVNKLIVASICGGVSQVAVVVKKKKKNRLPKRCRFDLWVGKIPWRRAWQPTPVFLPGESHRQRSQAGYSP